MLSNIRKKETELLHRSRWLSHSEPFIWGPARQSSDGAWSEPTQFFWRRVCGTALGPLGVEVAAGRTAIVRRHSHSIGVRIVSVMEHPRPAFDLLTALPVDRPLGETVFADWWARDGIDAEKGDDITAHPEIWEHWELPVALAEVSTTDFVSLQTYSGHMVLNAAAIGLGLDNVEYEVGEFSALVYDPPQYGAPAMLFPRGILFTIGETPEVTRETLGHTVERLESLGIAEDAELESVQTIRVGDLLDS